MADTKISALAALTGALSAADDIFPIVDISTNETKGMTRAELVLAIEAEGFTGPVLIGAASGSAGANDLAIAGSLFIGGTGAANELDDYEEGTWTPDLGDGTNFDATQTVEVGYYTKVGNLVHVQGKLTISSLGSISGNIRIAGLPFASANVVEGDANIYVGWGSGLAVTAGQVVAGYIPPNTSVILLTLWTASTGVGFMTDAHLSADGSIGFSASYIAA